MHGWDNNVTVDLQETGWEGVKWMHMAQDMEQDGFLQNAAMECEEFLDKLSDCQLPKKDCAPWS
jgi:hypothetical protein